MARVRPVSARLARWGAVAGAAALALVATLAPTAALTPLTLATPPDQPVVPISLTPLPALSPGVTASAAPLPSGVPLVVDPALPGAAGTSTPDASTMSGPGGSVAAAMPQRTAYQPSPDEKASLPNEPNRLAYEQQQSDVAYDFSQLDSQLAPIAVEAGGGTGRFGWPLVIHGRPPISQRFGCTDLAGEPYNGDCPSKRWHTGLDLAQPEGTPVFAADAGVVRTFRTGQGYGNYALVIHGNGYATLYGHLRDFAVPDGAVVKRGDPIGFIGSTGFSTGPHLHFEVRYETSYLDPCAELRC